MNFSHDKKSHLYTLVHRGTPGDVEYYVEAARNRRAILELGAGAGRITKAAAQVAKRVVGIEKWEGMLAEVGQIADNVELILGNACHFRLETTFDTVFIPYNTLFALGGRTRIIEALRCARQHVDKNAQLIIDCYVLDDCDDTLLLPVQEELVASIIDNGRRINVFEREEPLPEPRSFQMVYRYEITGHNGVQEYLEDSISHHWLPPSEMRHVFTAAGWRLERMEAAFGGQRLQRDDTHMVLRGTAAE